MIDAKLVDQFLAKEQLPENYRLDIDKYLMTLARQLDEVLNARDQSLPALVLGINGAQGTGKSTLTQFLQLVLENPQHGRSKNIASLSIDDFYWPREVRRQLAREVHPLLATRGVPGTHDVDQAIATIDALIGSTPKTEIALPRFNKASDDPAPRSDWPVARGKVELILLEGWFVGVAPQPVENLSTAINSLEQEKDADGSWRRYVNRQLAGRYQDLFARLDFLLMLKVPDFAQVIHWRSLQERKLAQQNSASQSRVMNRQLLEEFIQHFQRLTVHCLETLPERADWVLPLDEQHRIIGQINKGPR